MEILSAAIVATSLIEFCSRASNRIHSILQAAQLDKDHGVLQARLDVERDRLYQRAHRLEETDGEEPMVHKIIDDIRKILEDISSSGWSSGFGLRPPTTTKEQERGERASNALLAETAASRPTKGPAGDDVEVREAGETTSGGLADHGDHRPRRITRMLLSAQVKGLEHRISELTSLIDKLETLTDRTHRCRRSQVEVDITELAIEGSSSGSASNEGAVENVVQRQSSSAAVVQSFIEEHDRRVDVEGGQPKQRTPSLAQRLHQSIKEEVRSRPVSLLVASVASVTGIVSLARSL